ncbi:MAG TPA: hypothetical protein VEU28_01430 [Actinomycetota bacterium]|nr:hypothetical protein [Actinomycetota bacterium]
MVAVLPAKEAVVAGAAATPLPAAVAMWRGERRADFLACLGLFDPSVSLARSVSGAGESVSENATW